jgi:hypothetical protein
MQYTMFQRPGCHHNVSLAALLIRCRGTIGNLAVNSGASSVTAGERCRPLSITSKPASRTTFSSSCLVRKVRA